MDINKFRQPMWLRVERNMELHAEQQRFAKELTLFSAESVVNLIGPLLEKEECE
jgi:hypothetical protein